MLNKWNQITHRNIPNKISSMRKKAPLKAPIIVKNKNKNNMSKNRETEANPKKNQANIRSQENQSHPQVYPSLLRL